MKILIVADVLGVPNNGTTIAAYNLIQYLKDKGHEVRVLCCDEDKKGWPGYFICPHMNFGILNGYVAKNGIVPGTPDDDVINKALDGVDLVHCMMPFALGNRTAKLADRKGIAVTAGFHVQSENILSHVFLMHLSFLVTPIVYRVFWRKLYHVVDCIHYPTEFIKHDFERIVGPTNAYVISNGVKSTFKNKKVSKPDELKDKFIILMTGRYTKEKKQEVLLKAIRKSKYADKIQIILAGDGPRRKKFEKLSKKLPNKPIFGLHKSEELLNIINYSDLYVHTAYAELESIACLEAIKCGLVPVINSTKRSATKHFALSKMNLFKKNSKKDLVSKIEYWIEHEEERKKCSQEYINTSNHFDFNHCMERMEKMMFEAIGVRQYKLDHQLKHRIVYYKDPVNDDFAGTAIEQKKIGDDFVYVNMSRIWNFTSSLLLFIVRPLIKLFLKIKRGVKVHNRKVLKKLKHTGYFIYGNHTSMLDALIPQTSVVKHKKTYIIANPDVVSIKGVKNIVMMLGCLPTPSTATSVYNFQEAIKKRIEQKRVVAIYPEAHIWPFYTGLRDFSDVSFKYPAELNAPVVAMIVTYRKAKSKIIRRRPMMDVTLSEPIYPVEGLSVKENMSYLRNQIYEFMDKTIKANGDVKYINYVQTSPESTKYEK